MYETVEKIPPFHHEYCDVLQKDRRFDQNNCRLIQDRFNHRELVGESVSDLFGSEVKKPTHISLVSDISAVRSDDYGECKKS